MFVINTSLLRARQPYGETTREEDPPGQGQRSYPGIPGQNNPDPRYSTLRGLPPRALEALLPKDSLAQTLRSALGPLLTRNWCLRRCGDEEDEEEEAGYVSGERVEAELPSSLDESAGVSGEGLEEEEELDQEEADKVWKLVSKPLVRPLTTGELKSPPFFQGLEEKEEADKVWKLVRKPLVRPLITAELKSPPFFQGLEEEEEADEVWKLVRKPLVRPLITAELKSPPFFQGLEEEEEAGLLWKLVRYF
eukprot:1194276-Prorocentrum_minimum.AAC.4